MRHGRWLILAAIFAIVASVGATYIKRKAILASDAPAPPPPLESGLDGRANDWVYTQSDGDRPRVTVRAKSFRQIKAPSVMELKGVELQIYHEDASKFDLVKSAEAQFDIARKILYSDGDVEISMALPSDEQPAGRILKIYSSGVSFASDTGKAATDREARFEFAQGGGSARGAEYDPNTHQLKLMSDVSLDWKARSAGSPPMHVEAGDALYFENDSKVLLGQWAKFTRGSLHMQGGPAEVLLENGEIRQISTTAASGVQDDPGRRVEFGADNLLLKFGEGTIIQNILGQQHGKLISTANSMRTTVTADSLDMAFATSGHESFLSTAVAKGKALVEAHPIPQPNIPLADTRILRSEEIHLAMRPAGQEIEKVETAAAGTVDFVPNRPGQPKRNIQADKIWIAYGPENHIQSFRASNAVTRTDKPGQPQPPPMITQSKLLLAEFNPAGEMILLDQQTDFRYQEGTRRATGDRAVLEEMKDLMTLTGSARSWDPTGSVAADRIVMNQKSGDVFAEGHVATTRLPDNKKSGLLSGDDVMQGRSQRMTSTDKNQKIHYEGDAVVWQGANRVQAERVDIDRTQQIFEAHGKVVSQFADKPKNGAAKSSAPVFTVVRAPDLVYTDATHIAHYRNGASLSRPGLSVVGHEIRAYFKQDDSDSSLDKAYADGDVKIVSSTNGRTRTGTSDHAEYYTDEQKVIIERGAPLLVDSLKGQTRGNQLTWFANNDRLLVNGAEDRPVDSLLRKK